MVKMYKARGAKEYFNSLPDDLLDKNVVVSINDPERTNPEPTLYTICEIMVADNTKNDASLLEFVHFVHIPSINRFKEEPKQEPKKESKDPKSDAVDKLYQMAFDSIHEALSSLQENNNDMSIFHLDKAINSIRCKVDVQYGNSPWDPR